MTGYYDMVLGAIPLALFGISGTLTFAGLTTTTAVLAAATVAVFLIGHAMFVNGPVDVLETRESEVETAPATVSPGNAD